MVPRPRGTRNKELLCQGLETSGIFYSRFTRLGLTSHLSSHHNMIVSEKDSHIAALVAMNTAISSDLQKAQATIQNTDLEMLAIMKKDAEIHKLRGQVQELEEKVKTTKEELQWKKWNLQRSQKIARRILQHALERSKTVMRRRFGLRRSIVASRKRVMR